MALGPSKRGVHQLHASTFVRSFKWLYATDQLREGVSPGELGCPPAYYRGGHTLFEDRSGQI